MRNLLIYRLAFFALAQIAPHVADAQQFSTRGTEFWVGFMENYNAVYDSGNGERISVTVCTQNEPANILLEQPGGTFSLEALIAPNACREYELPVADFLNLGSNVVDNTGLRVSADVEITVYANNYKRNSADATVVLPLRSLRSDYVVMSYSEAVVETGVGLFLIAATADETVVEITPAGDLEGGASAGEPFEVELNAGETYQAKCLPGRQLAGTRVRAVSGSCKPFAVFGGAICTNVGDCGRCDHIYEQMFPTASLGSRYVALPLRNRIGYIFRVVAVEDETEIAVSGDPPFVLSAGETRDFLREEPALIESDKPIMVAQLSRGGCCDSDATDRECAERDDWYGDPFMLLLSPLEQMTARRSVLNALQIANIDDNFINVLTTAADAAGLRLNGAPPGANFTPLPFDPSLAYAQLPVEQAVYNLTSTAPFTAYVYGFGERDSYGYSGDAVLDNLALRIDGPDGLCADGFGEYAVRLGSDEIAEADWYLEDDFSERSERFTLAASAGVDSLALRAVVQSDEGDCPLDSVVKIVQVSDIRIRNIGKRDATAPGGQDGFISLNLFGGRPPYRFAIEGEPWQDERFFRGLSTGVYPLRATDGVCELNLPEITIR